MSGYHDDLRECSRCLEQKCVCYTSADPWDDYEAFQEYKEHGRVLSSEERAVERERERHHEQG
jgi:hypothetical protein